MQNSMIILLLSCCFVFSGLSAQDSKLVDIKEVSLKTPLDYDNFEEEILQCINWMEINSLDHPKRTKANALLLLWLEGTSSVTLVLNSYAMDLAGKNTDFLSLFMAGYSKYAINDKSDSLDELAANLAGVNMVLNYYAKGKDFGVLKDKKIEKLLKLKEKGKLEKYISRQI